MPNNLSKANPKVKPVCNTCGDEIIVDAYAEWDFEGQRWEVGHTFDTAWCHTCDVDTKRWSWKEENQ
jgi:hypothetical protein